MSNGGSISVIGLMCHFLCKQYEWPLMDHGLFLEVLTGLVFGIHLSLTLFGAFFILTAIFWGTMVLGNLRLGDTL